MHLFAQTQQELNEYFEGTRHTFNVPIRYEGSEFQMSVWQALQKIPYGQTVSYENLARSINHPQAQRAVGRANGDNRFAIIIPCHRVIRADGTLSGYGGGIWRKQHLLNLEQENVRKDHTTSKNLK